MEKEMRTNASFWLYEFSRDLAIPKRWLCAEYLHLEISVIKRDYRFSNQKKKLINIWRLENWCVIYCVETMAPSFQLYSSLLIIFLCIICFVKDSLNRNCVFDLVVFRRMFIQKGQNEKKTQNHLKIQSKGLLRMKTNIYD